MAAFLLLAPGFQTSVNALAKGFSSTTSHCAAYNSVSIVPKISTV